MYFQRWSRLVLCLALVSSSIGARASVVVDYLESPVEEPARWVLIGGTGATLLVMALDKPVKDFERDTARDKPLGKTSKYGDLMGQMVPNALYAGGMAAAGYWGYSEGYKSAEMMVMATAYAALATTVLKYSIREGRPYNSNVRNSFPSGHSTTAFAFAGIVAEEDGWWWGAPAMALATFVAYSRLNDHQHYLRDVVAGATVGLSCAVGVYHAHQQTREGPSSFQLFPQPLDDGMQLAASWRF